MDAKETLAIIKTLAMGTDPHTGEEFSPDSPYLHSQTVQALYLAMKAIEESNDRSKKAEDRKKRRPGNTGKAWEDEETQRLLAAFDDGKSLKQVADEHQRTEGGILSRLIMHGKVALRLPSETGPSVQA